MAYKRLSPTFNKEDKMTRTAVVNPDQSVTYKQSWSSSTPGASSSSKRETPTKRVAAKPAVTVAKRSTPPVKTAGQREITSIPPMKSAGVTSKPEIKASGTPEIAKKAKTPQEIREEKYGPVGERVYGKGEKKEKYATPEYAGKKKGTKASKVCKTC